MALADNYTLSAGDRLRITLLQNEQVNDTYLVGIDGTVSIPGIGVIEASGLSVRNFEGRLREKAANTIVDPSVSVEIIEYRPFFILGDVENAGKYPFTPDLNVMKAVAIAGGFGRRIDSDALSRAVAVSQARKSLAEDQIALFSSKVNLARLVAERNMSETFNYPADSADRAGTRNASEVIASARSLFQTRQESFRIRLAKLENTLAANIAEIKSFQAQIELQSEVLETNQAELSKLQDARERGIVSDARINQVIRDEQNVRAQTLQIATLKRQSEVNLASAEREITNLISNRNVEIDQAIQAHEDNIRRLSARVREDAALLAETGTGQLDPTGDPSYRLELYRNGEKLERDISYTSPLIPDDILFVIVNNDTLRGE